jgi:hypothetical protein
LVKAIKKAMATKSVELKKKGDKNGERVSSKE